MEEISEENKDASLKELNWLKDHDIDGKEQKTG